MARKNTARDMTDEQTLRNVFPKKVREELRKVAHEKDPKPSKKA